jgi:hypothetical protein
VFPESPPSTCSFVQIVWVTPLTVRFLNGLRDDPYFTGHTRSKILMPRNRYSVTAASAQAAASLETTKFGPTNQTWEAAATVAEGLAPITSVVCLATISRVVGTKCRRSSQMGPSQAYTRSQAVDAEICTSSFRYNI